MYHSVTIDGKNTYSDWHLVPDGRQSIAMPAVKTTLVEIPGASGTIDLSESLTNYPVYENREGHLRFHVLNDKGNWVDLYQEIANHIHGKRVKMTLEDDPDYYYEGRISIPEWEHPNDGTWSSISLDYVLDPYKYYKDPIEITQALSSTSKTIRMTTAYVGRMPVNPTFTVSGIGTGTAKVVCYNPELGISAKTKTITANGSYKFSDIILSMMKSSNFCYLVVSGSGTLTISMRKGEL